MTGLCVPKTACIAVASEGSHSVVDVPCVTTPSISSGLRPAI
jgi:hypothetical protein